MVDLHLQNGNYFIGMPGGHLKRQKHGLENLFEEKLLILLILKNMSQL